MVDLMRVARPAGGLTGAGAAGLIPCRLAADKLEVSSRVSH